MQAIVITTPGGPEVLKIEQLPDPIPQAGEVLIQVEAFGLNHAECYMRSGAFGEVARVSGIECAGTVLHDPSGQLPEGATVVAILGGMGRTRNGSYAELVTVPANNVIQVDVSLPWQSLASVPEVYATAWSALHGNLALQPGETIVIRGATSALGQAAVTLAVAHGATVLATTRDLRRADSLSALGAVSLIDDGHLADQLRSRGQSVDCLLDIVGNSVLRDSLATVRPRGRVCQLGFLGGLAPVSDFNPIADLPSGVQLSFFGSAFVLGSAEFPLTDIPWSWIFDQVASGAFQAGPTRTFAFADIVEAHQIMESGQAKGKMAVRVR